MEPIPLAVLLSADIDPTEFKLHCAVYNGEHHPIDVLAHDPEEWQRWNSWRNVNDDFNRRFIFSLAQDRHDPTLWLFGGIWEVVGRRPEPPRAYSYDVVLRDDLLGPFVRRLYVRLALTGRNRRRDMEACLGNMSVRQSWRSSSSARPVPRARPDQPQPRRDLDRSQPAPPRLADRSRGHEGRLRHPRPDHRGALRWLGVRRHRHLAALGLRRRHPARGQLGLKAHLAAVGEAYFRENLRFALLEFWSMRTDDGHVLDRETYWKEVLLSRSLGHNKN